MIQTNIDNMINTSTALIEALKNYKEFHDKFTNIAKKFYLKEILG